MTTHQQFMYDSAHFDAWAHSQPSVAEMAEMLEKQITMLVEDEILESYSQAARQRTAH